MNKDKKWTPIEFDYMHMKLRADELGNLYVWSKIRLEWHLMRIHVDDSTAKAAYYAAVDLLTPKHPVDVF